MPTPNDLWRCQMTSCGYVYNPERGDKRGKIPPGVPFENLPDSSWRCPVCKASKRSFRRATEEQ